MRDRSPETLAAEIVRDAGGQIVGRTKLQKVAYLLELAGLGGGFAFEYHHYGPYSEELALAIQTAEAFDLVREEERSAEWGGWYSVFTSTDKVGCRKEGARALLAEKALKMGPIELELAATAAYLRAVEGARDAWDETAKRKPEKARVDRLARARDAYRSLLSISSS